MPQTDLRLPGTPDGFVRGTKGGLYLPSGNDWLGFDFDPAPKLNGNGPAYLFTAQAGYTLSGSDVTALKNYGSNGGSMQVTTGLSAPAWANNTIGLKPGITFVQSTGEGLTSTVNTIVSSPFTVFAVFDYNAVATSVLFGAAEGASQNWQIWESGSNVLNMNAGATRSTTAGGWDHLTRQAFIFTFGNPSTDPNMVEGANTTRIAAGSVGTIGARGVSIGSNSVPETTNTGNFVFGYIGIWPGEVGQLSAGQTLLSNLRTWYDTDGA